MHVRHRPLWHDVVPHLEYGALCLEIVEDLGVHLDWQLVALTEHRAQAVVKHPC